MITTNSTKVAGYKFVVSLSAKHSPTGKRMRMFAKNDREATECESELRVIGENKDGGQKITAQEMRDATEAKKLFAKFDELMTKSLEDEKTAAVAQAIKDDHSFNTLAATKYFLKDIKRLLKGKPYGEVQAAFLATKRAEIKDTSMQNVLRHVARFDHLIKPDRNIASITRQEMAEAFKDLTLDPLTIRGCHATLSEMFDYAVNEMSCLVTNPIKGLPLPKCEDKPIRFLSVDEATTFMNVLLEHAPDLVAPHALGLFAGIRDCDIHRLDWSKVDLEAKTISLGRLDVKQVAGESTGRIVTMSDNLVEWLRPYAKTEGKIVDVAHEYYRVKRKRVLAAAGAEKWKRNCLRKSYATHHKAFMRNQFESMHEMGHGNPAMLNKWYAAHVAYLAGKAFFNIYPPWYVEAGGLAPEPEKIVPFAVNRASSTKTATPMNADSAIAGPPLTLNCANQTAVGFDDLF